MPTLYVFDLDGTLYRGSEVIPGAVETLRALRERGDSVRFITNNSGQTRAEFVSKLRGLGFEAHSSEVMSSGIGAASWLADRGLKRVFAVGEPGLRANLLEAGLEVLNWDGDRGQLGVWPEETRRGDLPTAPAEGVVAGVCRDALSFELMTSALGHLRAGARFIATNPDTSYPMEGGRITPGAGAVVAYLAACSGQVPTVIGKPEPYLMELILAESGFSPADTVMVGDRYDTDIECGLRAGTRVHLVLTGIESGPVGDVPWSPDVRGLL